MLQGLLQFSVGPTLLIPRHQAVWAHLGTESETILVQTSPRDPHYFLQCYSSALLQLTAFPFCPPFPPPKHVQLAPRKIRKPPTPTLTRPRKKTGLQSRFTLSLPPTLHHHPPAQEKTQKNRGFLRVPNGVFQRCFFRFLTSACDRGKPFRGTKNA